MKNKQFLLYLVFGFFTTIISVVIFSLFNIYLGVNEHIANLVSWILAVLFAFITNRTIVFTAKTKSKLGFFSQMVKFYAGRIATLLVEEVIIFIFITKLGFNSLLIKLSAQVIVIILNYIISKIFVFRNKGE